MKIIRIAFYNGGTNNSLLFFGNTPHAKLRQFPNHLAASACETALPGPHHSGHRSFSHRDTDPTPVGHQEPQGWVQRIFFGSWSYGL